MPKPARSGRPRAVFLLLALALLIAPLCAAYLDYDGQRISFGSQARLSVFSCISSQCYPGFINTSRPMFFSAARPLEDRLVEFQVRRAEGQPQSCVLRLVAPEQVQGQMPASGDVPASARFGSGNFSFQIVQAGGDAFLAQTNSTELCLRMQANSTFINFYLVPAVEPGTSSPSGPPAALPANASAPDRSATPFVPSNRLQSANASPPPANSAVLPAPAVETPAAAEAPSPLPAPYQWPGESPAYGAVSADAPALPAPMPLRIRPSGDYLMLSALLAAILLLARRFVRPWRPYAAFTLTPLAVGLFTLPDDGFRPIGLVLWVLAWLAATWHRRPRRPSPDV